MSLTSSNFDSKIQTKTCRLAIFERCTYLRIKICKNLGPEFNRFGKLGKTQGKPYCNSKAMGIHFPQPIFMSIFEKKLNFLAT